MVLVFGLGFGLLVSLTFCRQARGAAKFRAVVKVALIAGSTMPMNRHPKFLGSVSYLRPQLKTVAAQHFVRCTGAVWRGAIAVASCRKRRALTPKKAVIAVYRVLSTGIHVRNS
jgi:hypothetical protein